MSRVLSAVIAAAILTAGPAAAGTVIWNFTDTGGAVASVSKTNNLVTATATPLRVIALNGGANLSSLAGTKLSDVTSAASAAAGGSSVNAPLLLARQAAGLGVTAGGSAQQIDTNNDGRREAVLVSATQAFRLQGLQLGFIDNDDTLQAYGVQTDGTLVALGFGGTITNDVTAANAGLTSLAGAATVTGVGPLKTLALDTQTAAFSRYLFTTRELGSANYLGAGGQGYSLAQVTGAVPEPATWAMMIGGFGLVGSWLRRRQSVAAAA